MEQQNQQPMQEKTENKPPMRSKWTGRILSLPYWIVTVFIFGVTMNEGEDNTTADSLISWTIIFIFGGSTLGIWLGKTWGYLSALMINFFLIFGGGVFLLWLYTSPDPCMGDYECWGPAMALVFYIPILAIGIPISIFLSLFLRRSMRKRQR